MKRIPLNKAENALEKAVIKWLNKQASDYDNGVEGAYNDLQKGGCSSGMVSDLIYYHDTIKFYNKYKGLISSLLSEMLSDCGFSSPSELFGDKWEPADPLANDTQNQNLLAWFGFEETANRLANRLGFE